jgi:uncharacterized membrane protein
LESNSKADELTQTILCIIGEKNPQNVQELVVFVHERGLWSDKNVITTIMKLQAESRIRLKDHSLFVPINFSFYMSSNQVLWYWATIAISLSTLVFAFLIGEDFYPWSYIRNVLGLIFVLWLPGYTFARAFFPTNVPKTETSTNLIRVDRIALSIIMSMALVALIGLVLNFTPWGIQIITIMLSLLAFSLVFATIAVVREYSLIKNTKMKQML